MNTWKRAPTTEKENKEKTTSHTATRNRPCQKQTHHMNKPRRENQTTNRLPNDKPKIQKRNTQDTHNPRMASKHDASTTARRNTK